MRRRGVRQAVREGRINVKSGGCTYEALAQEAFEKNTPAEISVQQERLRRQPRRLSMAPAGIMRMRGKR